MDNLNIPAEYKDLIETCLINGFFDLEDLMAAVQSGMPWHGIVDLMCYDGEAID